MLLVLGTFRTPPENLAAARRVMAAMIDASRAEPGCLDYVYAEDLRIPGLIHVKEVWTDRAALDAHFASAHLAAWRASWPALGIADRSLQLFETGAAETV
jgi:quinol monooxygenase YgiN